MAKKTLPDKPLGEQKTEIKKRIRALKVRRDEAISREASKEVGSLRRGIRSLKRRSRELARAAKAASAPAPASS
jgi:hypothetical protein